MKTEKGEKKKIKATENAERKKLSKKQIIIIAVTCALLAATAIAVPVGVIFGAPTEVVPEFAQFDPLSDSQIVAKWKSVRRADYYEIEYAYESRTGDNVKKAQTTATQIAVTRKTGELNLRVKSNVSKQFSEWITLEISPMKLKTPTVSIGNDFKVKWSLVAFDYLGTRTNVEVYNLKLSVSTATASISIDKSGSEYNDLKGFIKGVAPNYTEDDFEEFSVTVGVRAVPKAKFSILPTDADIFLQENFIAGDYATATITVTKEIYEGLKND